jgi:hypothetical protein
MASLALVLVAFGSKVAAHAVCTLEMKNVKYHHLNLPNQLEGLNSLL